MNKISKLINDGDAFKVQQYLLIQLEHGKIFKFQIKKALDKIEKSPIRDDVFLPYIDYDKITFDRKQWNMKYLKELRGISAMTTKFDRDFVLHISDVSNHVYLKKRVAIGTGVIAGVICAIGLIAALTR